MKKGISVILAVLLAVSCLTGLSGCGSSKKTTLYVYNWGQYISEGDDGSLDVIAAFEEAYPNIRVQYSTYDSNEIRRAACSNRKLRMNSPAETPAISFSLRCSWARLMPTSVVSFSTFRS